MGLALESELRMIVDDEGGVKFVAKVTERISELDEGRGVVAFGSELEDFDAALEKLA